MGSSKQHKWLFFKTTDLHRKKINSTEHNLSSRVVKELTSDFQYKWHHVFFDNFFNSKQLLCDLEAVGLYGCGTARKDRKHFPQHLKNAKLHNRFVVNKINK